MGKVVAERRIDYLQQSDRLWSLEEFWLQLIDAAIKAINHDDGRAPGRMKWKTVIPMLYSDFGILLSSEQVRYLRRAFSSLKCKVERELLSNKPYSKTELATPLVTAQMSEYLRKVSSTKEVDSDKHGDPVLGPVLTEISSDVKVSSSIEIQVEPVPGLEFNERHQSVTGDPDSLSRRKVRRSSRNVEKPKPNYFREGISFLEETLVNKTQRTSRKQVQRKPLYDRSWKNLLAKERERWRMERNHLEVALREAKEKETKHQQEMHQLRADRDEYRDKYNITDRKYLKVKRLCAKQLFPHLFPDAGTSGQ